MRRAGRLEEVGDAARSRRCGVGWAGESGRRRGRRRGRRGPARTAVGRGNGDLGDRALGNGQRSSPPVPWRWVRTVGHARPPDRRVGYECRRSTWCTRPSSVTQSAAIPRPGRCAGPIPVAPSRKRSLVATSARTGVGSRRRSRRPGLATSGSAGGRVEEMVDGVDHRTASGAGGSTRWHSRRSRQGEHRHRPGTAGRVLHPHPPSVTARVRVRRRNSHRPHRRRKWSTCSAEGLDDAPTQARRSCPIPPRSTGTPTEMEPPPPARPGSAAPKGPRGRPGSCAGIDQSRPGRRRSGSAPVVAQADQVVYGPGGRTARRCGHRPGRDSRRASRTDRGHRMPFVGDGRWPASRGCRGRSRVQASCTVSKQVEGLVDRPSRRRWWPSRRA